jgi:hypothetical protein
MSVFQTKFLARDSTGNTNWIVETMRCLHASEREMSEIDCKGTKKEE